MWLASLIGAVIAGIVTIFCRNKPILSVLRLTTGERKMATNLAMVVGATHLLDLTGLDQYGNADAIPTTPAPTYTSDTPAVVSTQPSPDGNVLKVQVTAVAPGTANVTATDSASANPVSNPVTITVSAPPPPVLTTLVLTPE